MSSALKAARGIYRDVEKLYRLYGLYGHRLDQLEQHVKIVNANFKQNFREDQIEREWAQFDFLMSGVMFDGMEVFKPESPEMTFGYMLFCEGVKAILFSKGVDARDVLQWAARVRTFLDEQDVGKHQESDLASVLWKNPHPSIRVYLYNALLDIQKEEQEAQIEQAGLLLVDEEAVQASDSKGVAGDVEWHERDRDWELPSGELVYHQMAAAEDLKVDAVERLRAELADASVSERARKIFSFKTEDLEHLRQEMEMFDENHVAFNLLVQYFSVISRFGKQSQENPIVASAVESLAQIARAIVDRFHGGLIVFYLKKIQELSAPGFNAESVAKLKNYLKEAVRKPSNILVLADALNEPARMKIAKQLVAFLEPKDWPLIFDALEISNREAGVKAFLQVLIDTADELDHELSKWGEDRIQKLVPYLDAVEWADAPQFYVRCLRLRSAGLTKVLLPRLGELAMKPDEAKNLYDRLSQHDKILFLEGLLSPRSVKEWALFVRRQVEVLNWAKESADSASLWARLVFRFFGQNGFVVLAPIVQSRKLRFWPTYPKAREAILLVAMQSKDSLLKPKALAWAQEERNLIFQGRELKERLKDFH